MEDAATFKAAGLVSLNGSPWEAPTLSEAIPGEQGDWWKVSHAGKEGYVGKKYVAVSDSPAPAPAKEAAPDTGLSAATISLSGGREAGSAGSSRAQAGGREAGERDQDHKGVNEK